MRYGFASLVAGLCLATSAFGQPVIDTAGLPKPKQILRADLTGDGIVDEARAYPLNDQFDVITIDTTTTAHAFVAPINLSDFDSLEALATGSLRVTWGCFACGRTHTTVSAVILFGNDQPEVIGYDYSYADRLYAAVFSCSVNLLTGTAVIMADTVETRTLRHEDRPYPAALLYTNPMPAACDALKAYDDAFLERHFSKE